MKIRRPLLLPLLIVIVNKVGYMISDSRVGVNIGWEVDGAIHLVL